MQADRDLELALMRLAWRLDALDKWRDEVMAELATLRDDCDALAESDNIAAAVAAAIRRDPPDVSRTIAASLSGWQKWGAFAAGALLLADAVKGLLPL